MSKAGSKAMLPPPRRDAAILLFQGHSGTEIARTLKISKQTVSAWMRDAAVQAHVNALFSRKEQIAVTKAAENESIANTALAKLMQSTVDTTSLAAIQIYYKYCRAAPLAGGAHDQDATEPATAASHLVPGQTPDGEPPAGTANSDERGSKGSVTDASEKPRSDPFSF